MCFLRKTDTDGLAVETRVSLLLFTFDHSILQLPCILPELTAPAPTSGLGAVSPRQHRPVPGPMPPVPRMCVSVQAGEPEASTLRQEQEFSFRLRPAIPRFPGDRETPNRRQHPPPSRPPFPPFTSSRSPSLRDDANQWGGRALRRVGRAGERARVGGSGRRRRGSRTTI